MSKLLELPDTVDLPKVQAFLTELLVYLKQIRERLQPFDELKAQFDTKLDKVLLEQLGVTLAISEGLTEEDWDKDRLNQAYQAIADMINGLANFMFEGDQLFGLIQFIETFGGITIQLTYGGAKDDKGNITESYASTSEDGKIIYLYTHPSTLLATDLQRCADRLGKQLAEVNPTICAGEGFTLHTAANIVHEFGHVLSFKVGSEIVLREWDTLRNLLSVTTGNFTGFETDLGWKQEIFNLFENKSKYVNDKGEILVTTSDEKVKIEQERIANMFQAMIYGYELHPMNDSSPESRAALLMWIFMNGRCPDPEKDNISLDVVFAGRSKPPCDNVIGLIGWVQRTGGK